MLGNAPPPDSPEARALARLALLPRPAVRLAVRACVLQTSCARGRASCTRTCRACYTT